MLYRTIRIDGYNTRVPAENQTPRSVVVAMDAQPLPRPTLRPYNADRSGFGPVSQVPTPDIRQAEETDPDCSERYPRPTFTPGFDARTDTTPHAKAYPYGFPERAGCLVPATHQSPRCVAIRPGDLALPTMAMDRPSRTALANSAPRQDWKILKA